MRSLRQGLVAFVVVAVAVTGCTKTDSPDSTSSSAAASGAPTPIQPPGATEKTEKVITFEARVDVREAAPDCKVGRCWLPTQYGRQLVSGESVSKMDDDATPDMEGWPVQGQKVLVFCKGTGERLQNVNSVRSDQWFGIFIPANLLDASAVDRARPITLRGQRGYRAFVWSLWLNQNDTKNKRPDDCKHFD